MSRRAATSALKALRALVIAAAIVAVPAAIAMIVAPPLRHPLVLLSLAREEPPRRLMIPVADAGPERLIDTWNAARPGGRRHEGIDIFAVRGIPVTSATRGIVLFSGTNELGGHVVRIVGPGLEVHYYAHMDRPSDRRAGEVVNEGEVIGYVGNSGNAQDLPTHLHYGVYSRSGEAMNPYPRLAQ